MRGARRRLAPRQLASYLTWGFAYEFLRVVTHARVLRQQWTMAASVRFLSALQQSPSLGMLVPTDCHAHVLSGVVAEVPELSGNIVHDTQTAVLMREHGIRSICTRARPSIAIRSRNRSTVSRRTRSPPSGASTGDDEYRADGHLPPGMTQRGKFVADVGQSWSAALARSRPGASRSSDDVCRAAEAPRYEGTRHDSVTRHHAARARRCW